MKKLLRQLDGIEAQLKTISRQLKKQEALGSLIRQLPDVLTATYLLRREELEEARLRGQRARDLWEVNPGENQSPGAAEPDPLERPSGEN